MSKKPKNNIIRVVMLIAVFAVIGISITIVAYTVYRTQYFENNVIALYVLNTSVIADRSIMGFSIEKNSLNFGTVQIGGMGKRYFNVTTERRAFIKIGVDGNISNFVNFNENEFYLEANENRTIHALCTLPENTTPGLYTGKISVYILKAD